MARMDQIANRRQIDEGARVLADVLRMIDEQVRIGRAAVPNGSPGAQALDLVLTQALPGLEGLLVQRTETDLRYATALDRLGIHDAVSRVVENIVAEEGAH